MIREMAEYIEDRSIGLLVGITLHAGFRPETAADTCVALLERTGERQDYNVDGKFDKPVQILSRSTSYQTAKDNAEAVVDLFVGWQKAGLSLPILVSGGDSFTINTAELISGPAWLGQDQNGRHEFTANILLHMQQN